MDLADAGEEVGRVFCESGAQLGVRVGVGINMFDWIFGGAGGSSSSSSSSGGGGGSAVEDVEEEIGGGLGRGDLENGAGVDLR